MLRVEVLLSDAVTVTFFLKLIFLYSVLRGLKLRGSVLILRINLIYVKIMFSANFIFFFKVYAFAAFVQ